MSMKLSRPNPSRALISVGTTLPIGDIPPGDLLIRIGNEILGTPFVPPPDAPTKEIFYAGTNYGANAGDYRTVSVATNGTQNFTFRVPHDFNSLIALVMVGFAGAGAAGAGKDIDLFSDYGATGEQFDNNSESDTTSTFTLGAVALELFEYDISSVFSALAANDYAGIQIDHNAVGGNTDYIGLRLRYS